MFQNELKIAWRNLWKDQQVTLLNLLGLSAGLACVLLIFLWVQDERSIDKYHEHDQQLYSVLQNLGGSERSGTIESLPIPATTAIRTEISEVENAVVFRSSAIPNGVVSSQGAFIKAIGWEVTPNFFEVFSYPLIYGNKQKIFTGKNQVCLSADLAERIFGSSEKVVGKTLQWEKDGKNTPLVVSGVFARLPSNTSEHFDLLFPYEVADWAINDWGGSDPRLVVVVSKGTNLAALGQKITKLIKSKSSDWINEFWLQRYSDRHLYNRYENGQVAGGRIEYVRLFSLVAFLILLIACFNFINLSTAKSHQRMKEVGVKKVLGLSRLALMRQYLLESLLLVVFATGLALLWVAVLLPVFNGIMEKNLALHFNASFLGPLFLIASLTALLAGSYPAFFLSSFQPIQVLKQSFYLKPSRQVVRKALVVLQFSWSVLFIIAVLVVQQQMTFLQTKDLGYQKEHIIGFKNDGKLPERIGVFMSELAKLPGVEKAASFEDDLLGSHGAMSGVKWDGKSSQDKTSFGIMLIDPNLLPLLEVKTQEGRVFLPEPGADNNSIIFNEAAIKAMNLQNPIGQKVWLDMWNQHKVIVGVVKDFHFESMHKEIMPCFFLPHQGGRNILVKLKPGMEKATLAKVETLYASLNQGLPFEFHFLDDELEKLYTAEQKMVSLSKYFAGLAILISCLGLFSLAAYTAERRTKEIGIRKVLGATVTGIMALLTKDFLKLVGIAMVIAVPLAYYFMENWLATFAYRIYLGWWVFSLAALAVVVIAVLTVSFQAAKAALTNPVESLRGD